MIFSLLTMSLISDLKIRRKIISMNDYQTLMGIMNRIRDKNSTMNSAEKRMCRILKLAKKKSKEGISSKIVSIGSRVSLKISKTGKIIMLTLVLPKQEDVKSFRISVLSSLGVLLFASEKGEYINYRTGLNSFRLQIINIK
jgi:transcription elongation GreA/GreB family factor